MLSRAKKQKIFGPLCDSSGVHVTLTYHCCGPLYCASADFWKPGGEVVEISTILKEYMKHLLITLLSYICNNTIIF